ncbi:aminotransferase class V-fold PLP-dependent enzyme [Pandoraea cepalis]|uniref:Cysteine desulfurase n=1 Tax=Pandoraea cepalis TaxID=2508294 RepID=A0A5E4RDR6_9BURK|nr:aminotransferase class V-fold PLP-dependent enzyme [Pandoraea cepalis]VVD61516.1 cysteine desulfurase [Pandoraea cepalis]
MSDIKLANVMSNPISLSSIRDLFPVTKHLIYLDAAHQTPLSTPVRRAIEGFLDEGYEAAGPKPVWMRRVEEARACTARFIHASPGEIAFTKNTSEGLNIAANAVPLKAGDNVVLIEGDHPNNAYAWLNLQRKGIEVRFAKLTSNTDVADANIFAPLIDHRTKVITLSHVTFHAGQRHDIASIGRLCRERDIYLIVDAMQSVGVLPLDVDALGVDMLAAGCHKGLLVPQGLGFLYVRAGLTELQPTYLAMSAMARPPANYVARPDDMGTRDDASRFELGNFNLPHLHALMASVALIERIGLKNVEEHMLLLGDRLIGELDALGVPLVGPRERRSRSHIYVLALPAAAWTEYFAENGVRVSPERDGIRISFGIFNTSEDVDAVVEIIRRGLAAVRATTPVR